ncbi:MAG TPA: nucleotidyl transferase AbiEii/AbiGii toxin family protein [Planctomycetota bacterium]|nr:nucleotidyl transferase AbiEii/AbiGii toxin family protein [Planctomycetota bacterium]
MTSEPRTQRDYGEREIEAARRVLIDLGQVLGSFFEDGIVLVGGLVPDLLVPDADEPHIGSIDVDLALDVDRLVGGRYARVVQALLATGRYEMTEFPFKLGATVDLGDGGPTIVVDVDFLKAPLRPPGNEPRILEGFRPIDADACPAAFRHPSLVPIRGLMINGIKNDVTIRVAAIEDFLVMKAFALAKRDKPKDAYDICWCLDHAPGGVRPLAVAWRDRLDEPLVVQAIGFLGAKFVDVDSYGPRQVADFYGAPSGEERDRHARRAFELVGEFLSRIGPLPGH